MKKHYDSKFLLVGAAIAVVFFLLFSTFLKDDPKQVSIDEQQEVSQEDQEERDLVRRYSDGVFIEKEEQVSRLYAVMIENSAEAWPLQGLADARLVFEAPVEGAIPRFMAVYDELQALDEIGPVRSARPYYVDWVYGLDALYAHVGGSPEALDLLRQLPVKDLNEFYWGRFFWRSQKRFAPHNVYTSINDLTNAFDEREFEEPELALLFDYDEKEETINTVEQFIEIPFSPVSSIYHAGWEYVPEQNQYLRYQGGEIQEEKDGQRIYASNIVVLFSDISVIDDVGRRRIRTIGKGDALLFKDGVEQEIQWEKESRDAPLRFITNDEENISLNAGSTWVEVVSDGVELIYNNA